MARNGPARAHAPTSTGAPLDRTKQLVSDAVLDSAVPWLVAEAVLLRLVKLRPQSLRIVRDGGRRIARHLDAAEPDDDPWCIVDGDAKSSCLVWISDAVSASNDARVEVLELAKQVDHDVLLCESIVPGTGVGLHLLRAIDPGLTEISTDELADGPDRTRERKPWEPRAKWVVAHACAWRFEAEAELARDGFVARLPRMSAAQILLATRRILARFERAHELYLLAIEELLGRNDLDGARMIFDELGSHGASAGPIATLSRAKLRHASAFAMTEHRRAG